jgi:hypothetical protein
LIKPPVREIDSAEHEGIQQALQPFLAVAKASPPKPRIQLTKEQEAQLAPDEPQAPPVPLMAPPFAHVCRYINFVAFVNLKFYEN